MKSLSQSFSNPISEQLNSVKKRILRPNKIELKTVAIFETFQIVSSNNFLKFIRHSLINFIFSEIKYAEVVADHLHLMLKVIPQKLLQFHHQHPHLDLMTEMLHLYYNLLKLIWYEQFFFFYISFILYWINSSSIISEIFIKNSNFYFSCNIQHSSIQKCQLVLLFFWRSFLKLASHLCHLVFFYVSTV